MPYGSSLYSSNEGGGGGGTHGIGGDGGESNTDVPPVIRSSSWPCCIDPFATVSCDFGADGCIVPRELVKVETEWDGVDFWLPEALPGGLMIVGIDTVGTFERTLRPLHNGSIKSDFCSLLFTSGVRIWAADDEDRGSEA